MNKYSVDINGVEIIATPAKGFNLLSDIARFANSKEYKERLKVEDSIRGRTKKKQNRYLRDNKEGV